MERVPITVDFSDDLKNFFGYAYPEHEIMDLFKNGFIFQIAPSIECDGYDEEGNYINPRLVSLSIVTASGFQYEAPDWEKK